MKLVNYILPAAVALLFCACSDEDKVSEAPPQPHEVTTLNVDVVLPSDIRQQWQNSIDWALDNISNAQQPLSHRVELNLRYHDEDTEDLDALAYSLTHPEAGADTCHAIIGPYHSSNAPIFLSYAANNRLPVVMPSCTSSELQRINAHSTNAWFLTESDITQCEMMVAGASEMGGSDVALIYSNDIYGQSFRDWFGYYATERQIHLPGEGSTAYTPGTDLTDFLKTVADDLKHASLIMCIALGDRNDFSDVTEQVRKWAAQTFSDGKEVQVYTILSDTALEETILQNDGLWFHFGIAPMAAPAYGFIQNYEVRYGALSSVGYSQMYDALTLVALGAARQHAYGDDCVVAGRVVKYAVEPYGPLLTDHMRSLVASEEGTICGWDDAGLARAFRLIAAHQPLVVTGASGSLTFDEESHTKVLNSNYMLWLKEYDEENGYHAMPIFYISSEGSSTQASSSTLWELDKQWGQVFDNVTVDHDLQEVADRWAVVVSPSTTWINYRHQADAFAMYQTLRQHGYDDDHIVLIVEDNLADNSRNSFTGEIFVERSSGHGANKQSVDEDVRRGAVVDYHFSDLQPADLADIMMGHSSPRLPHVIHPTAASNVFFFWSGHGNNREGPIWGNEDAKMFFGKQRIRDIVATMAGVGPDGVVGTTDSLRPRMYNRMMLALETCYSGQWGEMLEGLPDVLVLTAANAHETSKADMYDNDLGVYLSNAFSRIFRSQIAAHPDITIYDLYRELFRTTKGSHVSIYNQQQYGSVYEERMSDFLPE